MDWFIVGLAIIGAVSLLRSLFSHPEPQVIYVQATTPEERSSSFLQALIFLIVVVVFASSYLG